MRRLHLLVLLAACSDPTDQLAKLAEAPACETDADCCVVTDGCMATSYVVRKADFQEAKDLAREAEDSDTCVGCIAPLTDVRCDPDTKRCAGREIEAEMPPAGLAEDHCGSVVEDPWPGDPVTSVLGCGAE